MTSYTAIVTVADDQADPEDVLDALVGRSPVWADRPDRRAAVTLSVDAARLAEAAALVLALVEDATSSTAVRLEIMTSAELDAENGVVAFPA